MKEILNLCDHNDLKEISDILKSHVSFTSDTRRNKLLSLSSSSASARIELIDLMDKQIRYFGSSDIAFIYRELFSKDKSGEVTSVELIQDVCKKLQV